MLLMPAMLSPVSTNKAGDYLICLVSLSDKCICSVSLDGSRVCRCTCKHKQESTLPSGRLCKRTSGETGTSSPLSLTRGKVIT